MAGLIAHIDTNRTDYNAVKAIPTPERTRTWGTIGHGEFVDLLTDAIADNGYRVIHQEFSLSKNGGKMFGVLTLDVGDAVGTRMIGCRNSIDKSLAAGITAGRRVTVCDNLLFSGEFISYHVHYGRLTINILKESAQKAIRAVADKLETFEQWHMGLQSYKITKRSAQALTFRAVENNVLPEGSFAKFYQLFFEKKNDENLAHYDDSLYGFHGAITQLWGRNSLISTGPRHAGLVELVNNAIIDLDTNGEIRA